MDYDANPIQVFTPYTYEQMKAFQLFHTRRMRRISIALLSFFLLSFIFSLVLSLSYGGSISSPIALLPYLFWMAVLVFLLLVSCGVFYTRKAHAKATKFMQNGQYYSFCNNDYAFSSEQQDNMMQGRAAYSVIFKICETKDVFYIYNGKNQALLIDKAGFRTGGPDELRALLQCHVSPKKYKAYF